MTLTVYVPFEYIEDFFDYLTDPTAKDFKYGKSVLLRPAQNTSERWVQVNLDIEQWNKVYYNIL